MTHLITIAFILSACFPQAQIVKDNFIKEYNKVEVYSVKKGENLLNVARLYGVHSWYIKKLNGLESEFNLEEGQLIKIPNKPLRSYEGLASWYGPGFHGKTMANGEIYDQNEILIAHRIFPLGSKVKVTNQENGKYIIAEVKDRGPYTKVDGEYHREVDLSKAAAKKLGSIGAGLAPVKIELLGTPTPHSFAYNF